MNSSTPQIRTLIKLFNGYVNDNYFNRPFINYNNEIILMPRINLYFRLDDIENETQLKCKIFEWCSRDAHKTEFYNETYYDYSEYEIKERKNYYGIKMNKSIREFILKKINQFLGTNFTQEDMEKIYINLGNGINRTKTIKFIESGYDMNVLNV